MSESTSAQLQSALAAEFDRRGWEWDLATGRELVSAAERAGTVEPAVLAQKLPPTFLERNGITREAAAAAIQRAIGGRVVARETAPVTIQISDNRYQVNLGPGAQVTHANVNVGEGTQINVSTAANRDEVLAGVKAILRAGVRGDFNADAARALAEVLEERGDVAFQDVQTITAEVIKDEQPGQGQARQFLNDVMVAGVGGALGTGIAAGIGAMLPHLPL